ncbi:MAG: hypothetical protein LBJ80_00155 [Rickettsiales bacterium]|nr:hypothetical protein [Rickettsiales bacterium]
MFDFKKFPLRTLHKIHVRRKVSFLFTSKCPNIVVVAARSAGKTIGAVQSRLYKLLIPKPNNTAIWKTPEVAWFSSTIQQAHSTVETAMNDFLKVLPPTKWSYHGLEHVYKINVGKDDNYNKDIRKFCLFSYENQEFKRGYHPSHIVLDEAGNMPDHLFDAIIYPMLEPGLPVGSQSMLVIGTANGKNKFYELWERGGKIFRGGKLVNGEKWNHWESYMIKASDYPELYTKEYIENAKKTMTQAMFSQELECNFDASNLVGSVFGDVINKYTRKNIKEEYGYDTSKLVYTAWDLGHTNQTVIWFFQVCGKTPTFIDYLEGTEHDKKYYASELKKLPYVYDTMFLPHDADHHTFQDEYSVAESFERLGFHTQVLKGSEVKTGIRDGIDAARDLLKIAKFHPRCEPGIDHLMQYVYEIDNKTGIQSLKPKHTIHSNAADGFRYAAISEPFWDTTSNLYNIVMPEDYNVIASI